jgi:hypothetical protein
MFSLVLVACDAATYKVSDDGSYARNEEVCAAPVECHLGALMSSAVHRGQEIFHQRRGGGHINAAIAGDQIIYDDPLLAMKSISYAARRSSNSWNEGAETAIASADVSVSLRDRALATTFILPGLYSTQKSNPSNLVAH